MTYTSNREEHWTKASREDYPIPTQLTKALSKDSSIRFPLTKKGYDLLLHTVKKVREHGGQFEVLLKVKQADDNPDFDFLNIDSDYHALYVYLKGLDQESFWNIYLCKLDAVTQPVTSDALNMLGSYADEEAEEISAMNTSVKLVDDLLADLDADGNILVAAESNHHHDEDEKLAEKKKHRLQRAKLLLHQHQQQLNADEHDQKRIKASS
jgi:hypothetical protein